MGIESSLFNFNNGPEHKPEHKPDAEQLDINFGVDENGNLIGDYDGEDFINLEEQIKKNREGSEGEYHELTEEELEKFKREKPAEYNAIMAASKSHEHNTVSGVKPEAEKEIKELHTEFDLEEEIAKEEMNKKENPGEDLFTRFYDNIKKPELNKEKAEGRNNIKNEKPEPHHHKNRHHGGRNINGPIMPFDPLK